MNPNTVLVKMPDAVAIRYVENRRNERTAIAQYTATPDLLTCWTGGVPHLVARGTTRIRQDPGVRTPLWEHGRPAARLSRERDATPGLPRASTQFRLQSQPLSGIPGGAPSPSSSPAQGSRVGATRRPCGQMRAKSHQP